VGSNPTLTARILLAMGNCLEPHKTPIISAYNRRIEGTQVQTARLLTLAYILLSGSAGLNLCAAEVSYFHDIRQIIQRQCQGCHQPSVKSSNLDLTSYAGFQYGGKRGPAAKTIVSFLTGESKPQMPLGQPPLPPEQIGLFRAWIAAGAKDDTPAEAREDPAIGKPTVYTQPPVLNALAFSPDGKTLAVSGNREILLHQLDGASPPKRLLGRSERILSLAFSKDGSILVAAGGTPAHFGEIQIWDLKTEKLRQSVTLTGDTVFGASLSPDASKIAVGCADNTVRIIDASTGTELFKIGNHENWVLDTVFGVDGKRIVSVGRDRAAKLTDATSGAFLENINLLRGELATVARHPAKDIVVIGGEDRTPYIYLMDRAKNMKIADDTTLVRKLDRQSGAIFALAWSPDGARVAVAGASPEVTIYDADSGKLVATCKGHDAGIYTIAFSPDGQTLATAGFDGQVRLYRTNTGELAKGFTPVPITATPSATNPSATNRAATVRERSPQ
jgi:tricorn protease-like protein/mono/diheme cytochrome c family protein